MEIKFWCNHNNKYIDHGELYLNDDLEVYSYDQSQWEPYMSFHKEIEPHFYLNGERVE